MLSVTDATCLMKVLLDECVTRKLKSRLPNLDVYTVTDMQWNGLRNGNLMRVAIGEGFDVLLKIRLTRIWNHQQNLKNYDIIIAVFDVVNDIMVKLITEPLDTKL